MLTAVITALFTPTLIGWLVIYHVVRPQKLPADQSNRINKIRLIWFAMSREDWLAQRVEWLRNDEMDNMTGPDP